MKKLIPVFVILLLSYSCQQEVNVTPANGTATFSPSQKAKANGRIEETPTPAFVMLSIKGSNGSVQENVKLPLFAFGQSYLTEGLTFVPGTYQLTQFVVLDDSNKIIYATPLEGSDLAKYVTDPLPMQFTVSQNKSTQVVPQVLAVSATDTPEDFGYVSFGFEVVAPKLKTMSNYVYANSQIPQEKFYFYYDERGRLSSYDRYVPTDSVGGFRLQLHFTLEYFIEGSDSAYMLTAWGIANGDPDSITGVVGRRKVFLDANSNLVQDVIYNLNPEWNQDLIQESTYSRFTGGYTVIVKRWQKGLQGNTEFFLWKISYETDNAGNVTRKRVYDGDQSTVAHFEYFFTHDSKMNPLFNLPPYFTDITSSYRYVGTESRNNVVKITQPCLPDLDCEVNFDYKYQNGNVIEMIPGGLLLYKRTFEYY